MRYFTAELCSEMQNRDNVPFQEKWNIACVATSTEKKEACYYLTEENKAIMSRNWHDEYVKKIIFVNEELRILIDKKTLEIEMFFYPVKFCEMDVPDSDNNSWLYDEFRRLPDGTFEWAIKIRTGDFMRTGEIVFTFEKMGYSIKRKSNYLTEILNVENIKYINKFVEMYNDDKNNKTLEKSKNTGIIVDFNDSVSKAEEYRSIGMKASTVLNNIMKYTNEYAAFAGTETLSETEKDFNAFSLLGIALFAVRPVKNTLGVGALEEIYKRSPERFKRVVRLLEQTKFTELHSVFKELTVTDVSDEVNQRRLYNKLHSLGYMNIDNIDECVRNIDYIIACYILSHIDEIRMI